MDWTMETALEATRTGLVKGCLAGLALAALFFAAAWLMLIALRALGMDHQHSLVIAGVAGPAVVSVLVLGGLYWRAQRAACRAQAAPDDATTTSRDAA
jgi:hypothetical protein